MKYIRTTTAFKIDESIKMDDENWAKILKKALPFGSANADKFQPIRMDAALELSTAAIFHCSEVTITIKRGGDANSIPLANPFI